MTLLDPVLPETTANRVHPTYADGPGPAATVLLGLVLIAGWCGAIGVALAVQTPDRVHDAALFLHLAFLIAGFGAVLTLDWFGLRWVAGRATLGQVAEIAEAAHLLIWIGLLGLTATGMLLEPALHPWTCVKLVAVLAVALNGINAMRLNARLVTLEGAPTRHLLIWTMTTAGVSQAGWWTACLIGFVNAH